jgi:predicted membrane channel-forming protein YqfA (hemolysin III family)
MEQLSELLNTQIIWIVNLILILAVWESVWKMIALWKSARNKELAWFICSGVINTVGILPIIYILTHRKKKV